MKPLDALASEVGAITGRLEKRIAATEVAVTELLMAQEKEIADLQRRLAELERR